MLERLRNDDSTICLDGIALPNKLNFENIREALTDKVIELGAGDPLTSAEMEEFRNENK